MGRSNFFGAYVAMVFLNAFVDLGHKIIIQNTLFKAYDGDTQIILTAIVIGFALVASAAIGRGRFAASTPGRLLSALAPAYLHSSAAPQLCRKPARWRLQH